VRLRSIVAVDRLEIVGNGAVVAEIPLADSGTSASATLELPIARSGWYTLRAYATSARHPVLDAYPFGTTSPIYVTVAGEPVRSPADAAWFIAWLDRLDAAARAHEGWNDAAERDEVLGMIARARAEFASRSVVPTSAAVP
jgi:TolB protein